MAKDELAFHVEQLEDLIDAITALIDDPDISDGALREQLRELLEENDDER